MRDAKRGIEYAQVSAERVFDDDIQTIETGTERYRFLIDGREIQGGLKERIRKILGDYVLERLDGDPSWSGNTSVKIQDSGMDALFALEAELAISNLDSYRNQDRVGGQAQEIRAILQVNFILYDMRIDFLFEVFKALRRALHAEVAIKEIKLIQTRGGSDGHGAGGPIGVGKASSLGR